jgi:ATP-dependent Clp protease ATP-binding subunit ClpA
LKNPALEAYVPPKPMNTFSSDVLNRLRNLEPHLKSNIKGQDHVLPRICSVLQRGELNLAHPHRPKGSFLFVGPTGVGKTEITLAFTEYLCGSDHVHRFDMSEFQNQSSVGLLLGTSSTDTGMLGRALDKNDRGTLLFDEMERAHPLVLDLFLQILDAGRITLANGETRNLNNYYIVFTSNIGAAESMRMESSAFASIERTVLRRVDQVLRPELVARINEKLVFNRLSYPIQREICELMISREVERLSRLGHTIVIEATTVEKLVREGFHRLLGARPMRNTVDRFLQEEVAKNITLLASWK